jgi:transcriptional regulator with XRE-family HTH domain
MQLGVLTVSADSLRVYIRLRRDLFGYTQETFARAIDIPYPTYRDYEGGATKELKASAFARAVDVLNIPNEHIKTLGKRDTSDEKAVELANQEIQARAEAIADHVPLDERSRALEIVRQLRSDPKALRELRRALNDVDDVQQS